MSKFHPLAHLYSEGVSPIIFLKALENPWLLW